jgi:signal transduction histidine kinase
MDEKAFADYTKNLVQQGAVASDEKYVTENRPTDLYLHFLPFLQGMLYVGNDAALNDDELQLVQNLADAFSTAYARYEDFNKLDLAKTAVESAMSELKATQSQLVQQEKLASLGQLTAGIAHEIKNPLNFVNNFSEVSIELIDEVLQEIEKTQDTRDETLISDILKDIRSNVQKVHDHGYRANSIVTSMLQHSRGGTGKMHPTDLNALIKEYVNLSYHGMRASKTPMDVVIELNLDPALGMVSLIKEDFTRVVINLSNNAFDAMREKIKAKYEVRNTKYEGENAKYQGENTKYEGRGTKDEGGEEHRVDYKPALSIQTRIENGKVLIQFEDNGPGIPDEIKDKILQPFFTTKKGTEGTGLGLSITNDIVKAHGGELKVETKEGEGSLFIIKLPENT